MKNKKGFTLVELLAVIVILALIMGIAVVSIGGVLNSTRQSTFKETAVSIINGVRQQVTLANSLPALGSKSYLFEQRILEKGSDSPLGGSIKFVSAPESTATTINVKLTGTSNQTFTRIGSMGLYEVDKLDCDNTVYSFVTITKGDNDVYSYSICLTTGGTDKYINGTEAQLLDSNNTTVIK